jgi:hypothetical protein
MKKVIRFDLVLKDVEKEFKKGMGKGVLVSQEVTFDVPSEEDMKNWPWINTLIGHQSRVLQENVEVKMTEVE